MKYAPYSFSAMNTYIQCPRKYKYSKIDKIPSENTDRTALLKGSAIHDILEKFPESSSYKLAPKYQHIADKFIESNLGKKYIFSESIRELKFGLSTSLKECSFYNKDNTLFRGSIDHMCIIDDRLNLIDWKTGKYKDLKYQDFNQLIFYAIFIFLKYEDLQEIRISFVYVEHNLENDLLLKRENLKSYIKEMITVIKDIENDKEFVKNPSRLCEWCDFRIHCSKDI